MEITSDTQKGNGVETISTQTLSTSNNDKYNELIENNSEGTNIDIKIWSPKNSTHKKTNSLIDYLINHRNEIIDKSNNDKEKLIELSNISSAHKETSTDDIHREYKLLKKKNSFYKSLKWYFVYVLYGLIGGIIVNAINKIELLRYDMIFNILVSPIIYYHSPRNILTKINTKQFWVYYTIPFILGLTFRFLDGIPELSRFMINPDYINTTLQIVLITLLSIGIIIISAYYILISSYPLMNSLLVTIHFLVTFLSMYLYYRSGGKIHIHHYFLGLVMMLVSRNHHSNIVNIIHAYSYGIYIEGISKWGMGAVFWN